MDWEDLETNAPQKFERLLVEHFFADVTAVKDIESTSEHKNGIIRASIAKEKKAKLENKEFRCNYCDKLYISWAGRYHHMQSIHKGIRYQCDQCTYTAVQRNQIAKHIKEVHEEMGYKCYLCEPRLSGPQAKSN